jgi:hypothetical protein
VSDEKLSMPDRVVGVEILPRTYAPSIWFIDGDTAVRLDVEPEQERPPFLGERDMRVINALLDQAGAILGRWRNSLTADRAEAKLRELREREES